MTPWKDYRASVMVTDAGRTPFPATVWFAARSESEAWARAEAVARRDYAPAHVEVKSVMETR